MMRDDIPQVCGRMSELLASEKPGALIQVRGIESLRGEPMPPLNSFSFPEDMEPYLRMRAERAAAYWEKRAGLDDDLLPSIAPWYGIAEHTAFLGGEVEFSAETSYNRVILKDWADFDSLRLDSGSMWMRLVTEGIAYYREKWGDVLVPKLRGADGPSDIANIVRGNELFLDIYDEPEMVRKLADFCADAVRFTFGLQKEAAGRVCGGYQTGFDIWLPGDSIGQISEDASCMMSPESFSELFLDALRKTVRGYDHVMLHTHSLGKRTLPVFASVPEIDLIEISDDPNADRGVDVWRQYRGELGHKVVITSPTFEEMRKNADLFRESRSVIWYYAKDPEDAKRAVDWTRSL